MSGKPSAGAVVAGVVGVTGLAADVAGKMTLWFTLFGLVCCAVAGRAAWSIFEPQRLDAHRRHRARIRPRRASQWRAPQPDDHPMPRPVVRSDITPSPGRRMVALIPDDEGVHSVRSDT